MLLRQRFTFFLEHKLPPSCASRFHISGGLLDTFMGRQPHPLFLLLFFFSQSHRQNCNSQSLNLPLRLASPFLPAAEEASMCVDDTAAPQAFCASERSNISGHRCANRRWTFGGSLASPR
jgi:hypothetical protein